VEQAASGVLARSLRERHVAMITLGGIIGAGLFVGSSAAIALAGPAVSVSYLLAGSLILLVVRMLAELATADPGLGSFTEYCRLHLGRWAGFTAGWLYWYFWVVVVGIEAIAGAKLLASWIDAPVWQLGLALLLGLTAVNLVSTRAFGELEFWFASIKVAAIVAFIFIGGAWALGLAPAKGDAVSNLLHHGGFAPHGVSAILAGVVSVIFALTGAEIATIAAAESGEPARAIARMSTTIVWRLLLFYVLSMVVITAIVPWNQIVVGQSPFAQALQAAGFPTLSHLTGFVVLTAVLSCLNSGLYVSSRTLFVLADAGDAPASLVALDRRKVPVRAILAGGLGGLVAVASSVISPELAFAFLVNTSGATMLLIYLLVAVAYLRRRGADHPPQARRLGTRGAWVAIVGITIVLLSMLTTAELRAQLVMSLTAAGLVLIAYSLIAARGRANDNPCPDERGAG
jgi:GABA permease